MSLLNTQEIMEILPHRSPFLLIDTIEELTPLERAVARKCVTFNEPYFAGHFPGNPVMPGVLILEAMAQTGAVALLVHEDYKGKTAYFAGMDKVRFKRKVLPGEVLTLEVKVVKIKGNMGIAEGVARVDGQIAATATLTFAVGD